MNVLRSLTLIVLLNTFALFSQSLERGPYLQSTTSSSVVVRWRTDNVYSGEVRYGATPQTTTSSVKGNINDTDHEILLSDLDAGTKYYYAIYSNDNKLSGDDKTFFWTAPETGTFKKTRVWITGDAGSGDQIQKDVASAYETFTGNTHTDVWLLMGDNAYNSGTDQEYQTKHFEIYPELLQKTTSWSTEGNHERYSSNGARGTGPYYDLLTNPTNGEAGGVPSGTEAYYSFDHGNIHFVCLNSTINIINDNNENQTQKNWVQADLAANNSDWTIVFFHHPPFTHGSHNSDTESSHILMREQYLPILEDAGVDIVMGGHSHSYERSYLIDGFYGNSNEFTDSYKKDPGDGRQDGDGIYTKTLQPNAGTIYLVQGASGMRVSGRVDHNVMVSNYNDENGSSILDINDDNIEYKFINDNGAIRDYFTLRKDGLVTSVDKQMWTLNKPDFIKFKLVRPGTLDISVGTKGTYLVEFVNLMGITVQSFVRHDNNNYAYTRGSLSQGLYFVKITGEGFLWMSEMIPFVTGE